MTSGPGGRGLDAPTRRAVLVLTALVVLLFAPLLFADHILYERDLHLMLYGQLKMFGRCLAAGSWPLWDPYVGFGQPLLANPAAQVLYPWTWLSLVLSPERAYTAYVASHLLLSSFGLYALARRLRISPAGSLLAAGLWMTSGPLLSLVSLWHHLGGAAWIPWVLLAADHALTSPTLGRTLVWALTMAGQILAGSADMCVLTGLLVAAWALRFPAWRTPGDPKNLRWLASCLAAPALALALSAGMWLPAWELARASARAELPEGLRTFWSLHPLNLVQVLVPILAGNLPLKPEYRTLLFESREPFINSVYLGLASLPLVLLSLCGRSRPLALFFATVGIAGALLALGHFGIAYDLATLVLPPLHSLRYPAKVIVLTALAWSILAGLGLDAGREAVGGRRLRTLLALLPAAVATSAVLAGALLLGGGGEGWGGQFLDSGGRPLSEILAPVARSLTITGVVATVALLLLFIGDRRPDPPQRLLFNGAAALAVADLFLVHHGLNPSAPRTLFSSPPQILAAVPADGPTRLYAFDYFLRILGKSYRRHEPVMPPATAPELPPTLRDSLARQSFLSPPAAERWGLYGSFDHDWLSLYPKALRNLSLFFRATEETPGFLRLLRLGGVSYVVALHSEGLEDLEPRATAESRYAGIVRLFRVPDPLPRAYVAAGVRNADGLAALRLLVDPQFDPAREIVLAEEPARAPSPTLSGTARLLSYAPDRIRIEASLNEPAYVVILEAYNPGWHATVDGEEASVLRANVAFRAVPVPSGRHLLELLYRPWSVSVGLGLSSCAALAVAAFVFRTRGRGSS